MTEAMELCSNSLKRPLPSEDHYDQPAISNAARSEVLPTPPLTAGPTHYAAMRDPSPAPTSSSLSSVATSTREKQPGSSAPPSQKKRKLTPAEKETQRIEKEQRTREREEQRVKRDEEKRVKDEEKRRKKEEKEAKDREKDLERQRRDNEKQKKERAQMKLTFFAKPKLPAASSPTLSQSPVKESTLQITRRKSSSPVPSEDTVPQITPKPRPQKSDYERKFLPFQAPSHTTCAPPIRYPAQDAEAREFDDILQRILKSESLPQGPMPISTFFISARGRSRGLWQPNARDVMESLNGSSQNPIDLETGETYRAEDLLKSITIRHLHFAEDVRPPYVGSYTRKLSPTSSAKLRKNPFKRIRKDTNYDYDSEAEWEEPEEGEDILSEGEDDDESIGAPDEMEDFLDEDESGPKRRLITGDLKPLSTGICWHGSTIPSQEPSVDLDSMKLEFLLEVPTPSINPFSVEYWPKEGVPSRAAVAPSAASLSDAKPVLHLENGKIMPPRIPLQPRLSANGVTVNGAIAGASGPAITPGKITKLAAKTLDGHDLEEFREAVVDSNVPKTDILKALKKRFPKHTNDTIKATLTDCFEFSGKTRAEKKWVYVG